MIVSGNFGFLTLKPTSLLKSSVSANFLDAANCMIAVAENDLDMDAKITLSFDESIIERAKQFADSNNISLSRLTEMLFKKGFLARIFKVFARHNISIDLVSVSEVSVSVSLDNKTPVGDVIRELSGFSKASVIENMGMVSLIGEGITGSTKTIKKVFDILDSPVRFHGRFQPLNEIYTF